MEKLKMDHILKIMEQFEKTSIDTLKYKNDGEEILLTKNKKNGNKTSMSLNQEDVSQLKEMAKTTPESAQGEEMKKDTPQPEVSREETKSKETDKKDENLLTVESPIIGTFYSSPAPGKSPFVRKGDKVSKGDVLCIIEAMKVMNKIESEFNGEIAEICLEDGQPVEYGTCLFKIKPE